MAEINTVADLQNTAHQLVDIDWCVVEIERELIEMGAEIEPGEYDVFFTLRAEEYPEIIECYGMENTVPWLWKTVWRVWPPLPAEECVS